MITMYKGHKLKVFRDNGMVFYSVIRLYDGLEVDCGWQGGLVRECIHSLKEEIDEREKERQ